MYIWNVLNHIPLAEGPEDDAPEIRLWKLSPETFLVIERGNYLPLLAGPNYILIRPEYLAAFAGLDHQLRTRAATITDRAKSEENRDYISLEIVNSITSTTIAIEDPGGRKLWFHFGGLFVSEEIKTALESVPGCALHFAEGFRWWGG